MMKLEQDELNIILIASIEFLERHPESLPKFLDAIFLGMQKASEKQAQKLADKDAGLLTALSTIMNEKQVKKLSDNDRKIILRAINQVRPCQLEKNFIEAIRMEKTDDT